MLEVGDKIFFARLISRSKTTFFFDLNFTQLDSVNFADIIILFKKVYISLLKDFLQFVMQILNFP